MTSICTGSKSWCVTARGARTASSCCRARCGLIYTHVARNGPPGVASPLDLLNDVNADEMRAAVDATQALGGARPCAAVAC
jgi:hypothetical protein